MHAALRPYATAGLALAGAGVIAVSPVAPPPPTPTQLSTAAVQLSAVVDPLTRWVQVANDTASNAGEIATHWLNNPLPLTRQVVTNLQTYAGWLATGMQGAIPALQNWATVTMVDALETAGEQLQAGQPALASETIANALSSVLFAGFPLMSLLSVPGTMIDHLETVVRGVIGISTMSTLMGLVVNTPGTVLKSLGSTAQTALDAYEAGDTTGALFAIANAPAELTDALINKPGGILDYRKIFTCQCVVVGGPVVQLLLKLPEQLAKQIALPPPAAAATTSAVAEVATESPGTGDPAPAAAPEPAGTVPEATADEDVAPVEVVSSNGATDLSAGNKAVPGKLGTTSVRSADQVRASLESAGSQIGKGINDIRDNVTKSLKGLSGSSAKSTPGSSSAGGDAETG
ncbi:hypothetical protein H5U98_06165 [Mycolicibacterium boenickei]|uniref:PE-PGRS family protein n=1 Tax=Mycolicibacterium boenickei TaxID=146017 RepID=A0AAX3A0H3_9MYCO|nr:hypothetical protein [Mycolicibacterium boenickei]UNC00992.1 hypothetical protein H5U98_06165 [Mycolicibacterium boenickei]BBX90813.1 hypothetical protein MBOE_24620 [Mycolicibacterium boenickei]